MVDLSYIGLNDDSNHVSSTRVTPILIGQENPKQHHV